MEHKIAALEARNIKATLRLPHPSAAEDPLSMRLGRQSRVEIDVEICWLNDDPVGTDSSPKRRLRQEAKRHQQGNLPQSQTVKSPIGFSRRPSHVLTASIAPEQINLDERSVTGS